MLDVLGLTIVLLAPPQTAPPAPPPPPMPAPRDPATVKKGTSVIKGHVLTSDGRPLRRATVRVTGDALGDAVTTTTGIEGEYELRELPAGRYTVQATRSGYLPAQHGQRAYAEPGTPVTVANAETIAKIDLVMSRAGVVSGRVTDESGDAAAGVDMRAMQLQFYQGRKRLVPVFTFPVHTNTDDTGQYRLTGLPPGDYIISARLRDTWMSDEKTPQMLSYAPTYFPGTADVAEARRIRVASGQEAGAIDMALVPIRAATLTGTAVASDGLPLDSGRIVLSQEIMGPSGGSTFFAGNAAINGDGTWKIGDVPPGEYIIRATGAVRDRPSETAVLPIVVSGTDIEGLVVTADAGTVISGRVATETGDPLPSSRLVVSTTPVSLISGTLRPSPGKDDGVIGADGVFSRKSASGPVIVRVSGLPRTWAVKSIDAGGRDYAGLAIELRAAQPLAGVTIVVTNRLASLKGTVLDAEGKPATGTVLLFPTDSARWLEAAANQRTARADRSGTYTFDALRAGEYFVVALERIESWQMNDPDFLTPLRERASKVTIAADPVTLDLKVVR